MKTYKIVTFGCQMNENDSEKLSAMLEDMGYTYLDDPKQSDILIINTCSVRENADDRFFGNLGNMKAVKAKNPNKIIAVCGCMMQQKENVDLIKSKYRFVDIVFGTHNLASFRYLLLKHLENNNRMIEIIEDGPIEENLPSKRAFQHKGFVSIMNGCNNYCTYCIVPFTRGREKSRDPKNILEEVKHLVYTGCKEITLLGQNVNSYGTGKDDTCSFVELLRQVEEIEGLKRLRFMTSHPKDLSDELIEAIKNSDKLCHSIHLPFQAGSTRILKKMNRVYTKESYLALVDRIKTAIPDVTLSTDIIVGFPTETEEDFLETIDVVKKCRFDSAFTYIYSKRPGTVASKMDGQIESDVIKDRFNRLLDVQYGIMSELSKQYLGTIQEVMVEGTSKNNLDNLTGRTRTSKIVNFKGDAKAGDIVDVKITSCSTFNLVGEMV